MKVNNPLNNRYEIFPVPQNAEILSEEGRLSSHVHIIVKARLSEATLPRLQASLTAGGYTWTMSDKPAAQETNIFLYEQTEADEALMSAFSLEKSDLAPVHKEGYELLIQGEPVCSIGIIGSDPDGIHYGVVSLSSILKQREGRNVAQLRITDYPEIPYRGYIEGFYGYPWSHEDRMDLMRFGGEYKLNTYIYAPKDDPYHRKNWRELYPSDKASEIAELAAAGHANHLNFVWTIHPGDTIDLSSEEDFQSVLAKLKQLYSLGVRQFGVLFDDLVGAADGAGQAVFINRIDTEFVKAHDHIKPLITVGTRYCEAWGPSMTGYFKLFAENLHKDVEIMWTGSATMSNISREQFDAPKRAIESNRNLSVWWNYPVNDYCDSKILMGKIENLSSDLDNVNGFFSNPMNQPQASKQALFCIADHNWNTDAFDSQRSFEASFRALAPEVAEDLQIFASNSCYLKDDGGVSGVFLFDESWYLKDDVQEVSEALRQGRAAADAEVRLYGHFERMEAAAGRIREGCRNAHLVAELKPFLEAFEWMAQGGMHVMKSITAMHNGDLLEMERRNELAMSCLEAMEQCKVHRLKDGVPQDFTVDVGTLVIKPFIIEMIEWTAIAAGTQSKPVDVNHEMKNIALDSFGVTAEASSSVNNNEGPANIIKGTVQGGKWCSTEHRPQVTLDLQKPVTLKQYRIVNCGHPEAGETKIWNTRHLQILVSLDGEHFTVVDEVTDNTGDVINRLLLEEVTARYVRLQIVEPAQISIDGSGHTRIYAFELFDERYPETSRKVPTRDILVDSSAGTITIHDNRKGDVISLFRSLADTAPIAVSEPASGDDDILFEGINLQEYGSRIFVERQSGHNLPSVRTSKGI